MYNSFQSMILQGHGRAVSPFLVGPRTKSNQRPKSFFRVFLSRARERERERRMNQEFDQGLWEFLVPREKRRERASEMEESSKHVAFFEDLDFEKRKKS